LEEKNRKIDGQNHQTGDKKGRLKKGQKMNNSQEPKKKGETKREG
jgi:hypothetical protein